MNGSMLKRLLAEIRASAKRAAYYRLMGQIPMATYHERIVDRLVRQAEKAGYGDIAFLAEQEGQQDSGVYGRDPGRRRLGKMKTRWVVASNWGLDAGDVEGFDDKGEALRVASRKRKAGAHVIVYPQKVQKSRVRPCKPGRARRLRVLAHKLRQRDPAMHRYSRHRTIKARRKAQMASLTPFIKGYLERPLRKRTKLKTERYHVVDTRSIVVGHVKATWLGEAERRARLKFGYGAHAYVETPGKPKAVGEKLFWGRPT
jgi:hypothetical protein